MLPLVGGSWRLDLLAWSVPGSVAALLYAVAAPRPRTADAAAQSAPARWWPDWNSPMIWLLGLTFGSNNALFFAANAFVPDYLTSIGRGDMIGTTLGWLNGSQLVASFVMLAMAERLQRGSWPFTIFGPVTVLGLLGIVFGDGIWIVLSAAACGLRRGRDLRRHLRTAGDPEPARRRAPHGGRHVHHQLHHRRDRSDHLRRVLGPHRIALDRVPADRRCAAVGLTMFGTVLTLAQRASAMRLSSAWH